MRTSIRARALALALLLPALLVGCSPAVALTRAEDATNPACATVIVALRDLDTIAEQPSRETDAQGTAAWGNPASIILHCGVPVPAPTSTLPCMTVAGVDWLRDDTDDPKFVFTTYGRDPAVSVVVDYETVSGNTALTELAPAVSKLPAVSACTPIPGTE